MESSFLLTIGIPTYNRASSLVDALSHIYKAIKLSGFENQIEIVISDNASEDNTKDVVAQFSNKFQTVKYFKLSQNYGFDRNVYNVLKNSNGKWCWLLSDDDLIQPSSLKFLYPLLKLNHSEAVHICVAHEVNTLFEDIKVFKSGNELLEKIGITGGLISQNIFLMSAIPPDIEKYFNNYWIHLSIALEIKAKQASILVKNLFINPQDIRESRAESRGAFFYTYVSLIEIVQNLHKYGYRLELLDRLHTGYVHGLPYKIASAKVHGLPFSWNTVSILFKNFYDYPFWLLISLIIYATPNFVFRVLKKLKSRTIYGTT